MNPPIRMESVSGGIRITLRVKPNAQQTAITGVHDEMLKVSVAQAPERGKANKAIIAHLAQELNVKKSQLAIIAGETSATKKILLANISTDELSKRLERILNNQA